MNRRRFLQGVGAGAAASAFSLAPGRAAVASPVAPGAGLVNVFGRMFPGPAFAEPSEDIENALRALGAPGGPLDAADELGAGPVALILDPAKSRDNPDNPTQTAGTTFFGQFIDHDITFDASSVLGEATDPRRVRNERTAALDLDSVYGGGPIHSSHLYDPSDRAKLRIEHELFEDLPRASDMTALIGDPRNDENLVIAGLQCAFILFHNRAVDLVRRRRGSDPHSDFERARRLTTWHYQWMVVHEFLPQVVGQEMVDTVLRDGRRFYRPQAGAAMPVEFQGAAFRFGHSLVRPSYRANLAGDDGAAFFGFIFDAEQIDSPDPGDLLGGFRAPRRFIGWQTFFDFGDGEVKRNKRTDTKISTPLFALPASTIAGEDRLDVLPQRNLLRHLTWSMPSGQDIARRMHVEPLAKEDLSACACYEQGLDTSTPLWYYILREAEVTARGLHLGAVGGRIVAEVLLGLIEDDETSYRRAEQDWRPTLPTRTGVVSGEFSMVDFLTFAGVDPTSRGQ